MNKNLVELVLVIDKSSSMGLILEKSQNGINELIHSQKNLNTDCHLTLVEFSYQPNIVYENVNIKDVPGYTLVPDGMTALLDAIGLAINSVGKRLSQTPEDQRPGLVYVVVVTDGEENASKNFNRSQIKAMIQHQKEVYSWKFDFLGAGDTFLQGQELGFNSSISYNPAKTKVMYEHLSTKFSNMRASLSNNESIDHEFTEDQIRDIQ